jgi:hypothetical protein
MVETDETKTRAGETRQRDQLGFSGHNDRVSAR